MLPHGKIGRRCIRLPSSFSSPSAFTSVCANTHRNGARVGCRRDSDRNFGRREPIDRTVSSHDARDLRHNHHLATHGGIRRRATHVSSVSRLVAPRAFAPHAAEVGGGFLLGLIVGELTRWL